MYVLINKRRKYFENCNEIWGKVSNIIKKEFNSKLVCNNKYLKARKKYLYKAFYIYTSNIDSVYRKHENYYPKVFLEKYNFNRDVEYSDK